MEATEMPLEELKQATLAKVQEMVTDQSDGSPRYSSFSEDVITRKYLSFN